MRSEQELEDIELRTDIAKNTLNLILKRPEVSSLGAIAIGELGLGRNKLEEKENDDREVPYKLDINKINATKLVLGELSREIPLSQEGALGVQELQGVLDAEIENINRRQAELLKGIDTSRLGKLQIERIIAAEKEPQKGRK